VRAGSPVLDRIHSYPEAGIDLCRPRRRSRQDSNVEGVVARMFSESGEQLSPQTACRSQDSYRLDFRHRRGMVLEEVGGGTG
jgi:hypothetical protein